MRYILLIVLVLAVPSSSQSAQQAADSTFRVRCSAAGALMGTVYSRPPTAQSDATTFVGGAFAGRAVWHPNHRLAVGIQTGYVIFSRQDLLVGGVESGRAGLAAVPLHIVVAMDSQGFELGVGLGLYHLMSLWRSLDVERAASSDVEYGINPWLSYQFTIADRVTVGPELGAHILSNRGIEAFTFGLSITADVLRY